jgi:hypothetical protein
MGELHTEGFARYALDNGAWTAQLFKRKRFYALSYWE